MDYNAKRSAYKKLHGSMSDHYSKLGSYIAALKNANPSSTFELLTAPPGFLREDSDASSSLETFFRLFVCFDGLKKGILAGCRKVLCLDGCFLKTFLGGILLAAVGRDANNQMYPVAWVVVEGENNDSWEWFMNQLSKCLEVTDGGRGWTLISDQQKGLINAVNLVWKNAEHRNCARHIYANWKKEYKGEDYKEVYWRACRAYNEADYNVAMNDMLELSPDAVDAYVKQNPKLAGFMKRNSEEFVHESFLKEKHLKSYQFTIPPLPSEKYWPIVDYPIDPPPVKAMPGRPKKNIKRDPHEDPKGQES
ncbi:uncharacterized protein LOC143610664 [Bidens hawaiensis]|uniref:uncharacterized protein LOC143610664 n=1 Tax=Bidens hawaiensis TaxID=980011 RepID=UPI00404B50B8